MELADETRVLVHAPWVFDSNIRCKVPREDLCDKDVRAEDDEGLAMWQPRDDIANCRIGQDGVQAHGKRLLRGASSEHPRRVLGRSAIECLHQNSRCIHQDGGCGGDSVDTFQTPKYEYSVIEATAV